MKQLIGLKLGQQTRLTPQLQQAIRLLQLSSCELEIEVREHLESNPLLEWEEESRERADEPLPPETEASADAAAAECDLGPEFGAGGHEQRRSASGNDEFENNDPEPTDLCSHLLWQLNLTALSKRDHAIMVALIEAVEDDGYLREADSEIQRALTPHWDVREEEIAAMRRRLQHFDPVGVASRTLTECLLAQLSLLEDSTSGLALARILVADHLEAVAQNDVRRLCAQLHESMENMEAAIALIRSLNPRPGSAVADNAPEYIVPDAYATKVNGTWQVALAAGAQPRVAINQTYASLLGHAKNADAAYVRTQLQEARWLLRSLESRALTIQKVATAIVRRQQAFLDYGPEALQPLVLNDIAADVGLHESTVSRVTSRKYLCTPRGTFEFKYFFSSGVATHDGGSASSVAIQSMIRKLIRAEGQVPLSDRAVAEVLHERGIRVARRTVAKYRELLRIPPSSERVGAHLGSAALRSDQFAQEPQVG